MREVFLSNVNKDLKKLCQEINAKRDPSKPCITVCVSTGCVAQGSIKLVEDFKNELEKHGLTDKVEIKETGCVGFCEQGPRVTIYPQEIYYFKVKPENVAEIISETILKKNIIEHLL